MTDGFELVEGELLTPLVRIGVATVFCKDCKFIKPCRMYNRTDRGFIEQAQCAHESGCELNLVTGEKDPISCMTNRNMITKGHCGPTGKYFESKC